MTTSEDILLDQASIDIHNILNSVIDENEALQELIEYGLSENLASKEINKDREHIYE